MKNIQDFCCNLLGNTANTIISTLVLVANVMQVVVTLASTVGCCACCCFCGNNKEHVDCISKLWKLSLKSLKKSAKDLCDSTIALLCCEKTKLCIYILDETHEDNVVVPYEPAIQNQIVHAAHHNIAINAQLSEYGAQNSTQLTVHNMGIVQSSSSGSIRSRSLTSIMNSDTEEQMQPHSRASLSQLQMPAQEDLQEDRVAAANLNVGNVDHDEVLNSVQVIAIRSNPNGIMHDQNLQQLDEAEPEQVSEVYEQNQDYRQQNVVDAFVNLNSENLDVAGLENENFPNVVEDRIKKLSYDSDSKLQPANIGSSGTGNKNTEDCTPQAAGSNLTSDKREYIRPSVLNFSQDEIVEQHEPNEEAASQLSGDHVSSLDQI